MSTVAEKLHKWSIQELNLASQSGLRRIPDVESLRTVTKGKYKRVWTYVITHVRAESTVDKIKRTLYLRKLLKEKEENTVYFNDDSTDVVKLQTAISKATEKRAYLMQSLSTVKERILNLEQKVQNTKDETFQINQKTALLELLKQLYDEKNIYLKYIFSEISLCKNSLLPYQSTKVCDKAVLALPYDFLYENKTIYDQNNSRVKDLIYIISSIFKNNFDQKGGNNTLIENFQNSFYELKKKGVLLTDFVILLKEISGSDLQQFASTNVQSLSVNDFLLNKSKESTSKVLLTQLKCDNVYNSLSSIKNRKEIEKILVKKKEIFEDKIKNVETKLNDTDFEVKCTLFEKLAENDAFIVSNSYLEDYLKHMSDKTQLVLRRIRQKKLCNEEFSSVIKTFYKNADLTFHLLHTFPDTIQNTFDNVNGLQSFAHNELFESPLPQKEWVEELKGHLVSDRKLIWKYCDKTNVIQPLFTDHHIMDLPLSPEARKSLNFQTFQNISTLCENWTQFKQKLQAEVVAQSDVYVQNSDINVSELYAKILKMLEAMKFSIEKATVFINDGMTRCHRNKFLVQEWWEQNAQYIPHIEYEGKTLKMWIDILSVLSDFEPQNCI